MSKLHFRRVVAMVALFALCFGFTLQPAFSARSVAADMPEGVRPAVRIVKLTPAVLNPQATDLQVGLELDLPALGINDASTQKTTRVLFQMSYATTIDRATLENWAFSRSDLGLGGMAALSDDTVAQLLAQPTTRFDASRQRATITLTFPRSALPLTDSSQWGPRGLQATVYNTTTYMSQSTRMLLNVAPQETLAVKPGPLYMVAPLTVRAEGVRGPGSTAGWQDLAATPLTPVTTEQLTGLTDWDVLTLTETPNSPAATPAPTWPDLNLGAGWLLWFDPALTTSQNSSTTAARAALTAAKSAGTDLAAGPWALPRAAALASSWGQWLRAPLDARTATALTELALPQATLTPAVRVSIYDVSPAATTTTGAPLMVWDSDYPTYEQLNYHPSAVQDPARVQLTNESAEMEGSGTLADADGGGKTPLLLVDRQLSQLATSYTQAAPSDRLAILQLARGYLAMKTRERPDQQRPTIIALPSLTNSPIGLAFGRALMADPWVTPIQLTKLTEQPQSQVYRTTSQVSERTPTAAPTVVNDQIQDSGTPPTSPSVATPVQQLRQLSQTANVLSGANNPLTDQLETDAAWLLCFCNTTNSVKAINARVNQVRNLLDNAVTVNVTSRVNVISSESHLPVTLQNRLAQPVTIRLDSDASDARLQPRQLSQLTLPASGSQQVRLPLKAIGNGTLRLQIWATDSDGRRVSPEVSTVINVRAGIESNVLLVGAGILGIVFIAGLTRNIIRSRRFQWLKKRIRRDYR